MEGETTPQERKHKKTREPSGDDSVKRESSREDSVKRKERKEREREKEKGKERTYSKGELELEEFATLSQSESKESKESSLEKSPSKSKRDSNGDRISSKKSDSDLEKRVSRRSSTVPKDPKDPKDKKSSKSGHRHHHHHHRDKHGEKGIVSRKKEKDILVYKPSRLSLDVKTSPKGEASAVSIDLSTITKVEAPVISYNKKVDETTGSAGLLVKLHCPTPGAQIFYTFNDITPNNNSFKYNITGPFVIAENAKLNVIAMVRQKKLVSPIVTETLVI